MFLILITCRFHICESISSLNLICKTINTVSNLYYSKTLRCVSPAKFKRDRALSHFWTLRLWTIVLSMVCLVPHFMWFWLMISLFKKINQRQCWKFAKLGKGSDEFNIPKSCSLRKHPHQVSSVPVWVCASVYEFESL